MIKLEKSFRVLDQFARNPIMKNRMFQILLVVGSLILTLWTGCSSPSPYKPIESWAIRQNDIPQYATSYDILYFYPELKDWRIGRNAAEISDVARERLRPFCTERIGTAAPDRKARLFIPFLHADTVEEDVREAVTYYYENYHDKGRPFVLLAEGESVPAVSNAVESLQGWFGILKLKKGYLAHFLFPENCTNDLAEVQLLASRLVRMRAYEMEWNRVSPMNTNSIPADVIEALYGIDKR